MNLLSRIANNALVNLDGTVTIPIDLFEEVVAASETEVPVGTLKRGDTFTGIDGTMVMRSVDYRAGQFTVDNLGRAWPNDEMVTPSADTQVTVRPSAGKVPVGSLAPFSNFRFEGTAQIVMKSDSVVRCSSDEGFLGSLEITSETLVTPLT